MTFLKVRWLVVVMLALLTLAGCGGSGSKVAADPLAKGNSTPVDPGTGKVINYTLSLLPAKSTVLANDTQLLTAMLVDADSRPIANQLVSFSIVAGPATAVTTTMRTDSNGIALGFVKTGSTAATTNVIVQASASLQGNNVVGYGNFQLSPSDATLTSTKLSLSVPSFTVKPKEQLFVTALATDSSGNPLAGQVISWSVSAGPAAMLTTTATTDSNGTAVALVQAGNATAVSNVIVKATTSVNGSDVTAIIPFQVVPPTLSVLTYSMTMVPSKPVVDNNEEFYVTAMLTDSGGSPVLNRPVTFKVVTGLATVNTMTVNTDSTGKAIATLQAGNPGLSSSVIMEASVNINGTVVTALAPVQVTPQLNSKSVLQMVLYTDKPTVGMNSDVIVTATIKDMQEKPRPVQDAPVTFTVLAGPGTVVDNYRKTDSTGTAVSHLKVGAVNSSSTIVIQACATVEGGKDPVTAYTTIQVVRQDSSIINFLTTKTTTDPDGNLNTMSYEITDPFYAGKVTFKQLVPFQVLDNNGVPKPKVPVTIAVYNYGRNPDSIIELVPPLPGQPVLYPQTATVITDDHGMGIFTCNVTVMAPGPGLSRTESIIYSAAASIDNVSLLSYGGFIATVSQNPAPATLPTTTK
jgi:hypothetical protein